MATITLNNEQLRLIQKALDFYSRIGVGQFSEILEHPTFEKSVVRQFTPKKELEVGDRTMRGEIVEIGKGYIKTKGSWGNGEEIKKWTDIENVYLSPDWSLLHEKEDEIKNQLNVARNMLYGEEMGQNGSWGIYNQNVDESCREAWYLIQHIRHAFWLENPDRSSSTVDSSIDSRACPNVKVKLDGK